MGKTVGFMRSAVTRASGGRSDRASLTRASVIWSAVSISVPQAKSTEIWLAPRCVVERIFTTPGTVATASSSGRVTAASIIRAGWSPPSAITMRRGNVTSGRMDTGKDVSNHAPAPHRESVTNRIALIW